MIECPIHYYEKNLIFNKDKSCWGFYKFTGYDYDTLSEESKLDILHRLTKLIASIVDEATFLMIPSVFDLDTHYKNLEKTLDENDALYAYAVGHAEATRQYLKNKVNNETGALANDYEHYLAVKLVTEEEVSESAGLQGFIEAFIKSPANAIESIMHTQERDIMESKVKRFERLAERVFTEQNKRIKMHPATPTETQYLFKRATRKGIENDIKLNLTHRHVIEDGEKIIKLSDWTPYAERSMTKSGKDTVLRPYFRDVINLFQGEIDQREKRMLKITHDNGAVSYQTYLVMAHMPYEQDFPNNEYLYLLQSLNVQAEVCIHIKNTEHRQALRELELQTRKIKSQHANITEVAEDASEVAESYMQMNALEAELKAERSPITKTCISICLYGRTPEEVEEKAEFVRTTYSDLNFVIERPVSDQFKLFLQHIPGAGKYIDSFTMQLPPQTLAGGVIGANNQLGDNVGPYIGTTGKLKRPVFLDMGFACRKPNNQSASATIYGNLGRGKSFLADTLGCLNVFYGGYALIFDPHAERAKWENDLPMLKGLINTVTLSPGKENSGRLDPFLIYADDFDKASELALNVISELYRLSPDSEKSLVLTEAIDALQSVEKPCMLKLCNVLENFNYSTQKSKEAAGTLARQLRSTQRRGIASLLFGTGNEKVISLNNRMNILQIQNLKLPSPDTTREQFTPEENVSAVMMIIIANIAKQFMLTNLSRNAFSEIIFDESYMLGTTAEGIKLFDFLSRSGRKFNCGCIFNGHSVLDIPTKGMKNAILYKFCFYTNNNDEAIRMLEYLDMEVTPENIDLIKGLANGECLFRDMFGRVGVLKVDAVFPDLIKAFDTTPKSRQEAADEIAAAAAEQPEPDEYPDIAVASGNVFSIEDLLVREVI